MLGSLCGDVKSFLVRDGTLAVVHHWDSDGIASAAIVSRLRSNAVFCVPRIGLFSGDAVPAFEGCDGILVLDYGISVGEVEALEGRLGVPVAVVDHHVNGARERLFCNPVALGGREGEWPSTTWVMRWLLGLEGFDDLVALGLVGDLGFRAAGFLNRLDARLSLEELLLAASLVDSCYRAVDYEGIAYARRVLSDSGVRAVLRDDRLRGTLEGVEQEFSAVLGTLEPEVRGSVVVYRVVTDRYLTSQLGRELAARHPESIVVLVNRVRRLGSAYIYVRSRRFSLRRVLERVRPAMRAGGKDKVFVVSCRSNCEEELAELLPLLSERCEELGSVGDD
jgi:hypothetical protein